MKKKILLLVASLLFTVLSATTVFAANEITVNVNGEKVDFDVQPFIENDRVMIPLRGVTEKLGAEVEWDAQNKSAYIHKDTKRIICQVNNDNLYENIGILAIDVAPKIVNGRIFIPLRAVSESLDCNVQWDAATQTVNISENTLPFTVEYKTDTIRTEIPEADVTMIINYTYPKITDGKDFLTEEMVSKANEYAKKMRTEAFDADEYIRTTILTPTTVTENRRDENGHCDLEINIDQEVYASEKYGTVSFMTTYWDLWSGPAVTSATYNKDSFEKYRNYGAAIKIEPPTGGVYQKYNALVFAELVLAHKEDWVRYGLDDMNSDEPSCYAYVISGDRVKFYFNSISVTGVGRVSSYFLIPQQFPDDPHADDE